MLKHPPKAHQNFLPFSRLHAAARVVYIARPYYSFQLKVCISSMISSRIYWIAGANESALGLQSKIQGSPEEIRYTICQQELYGRSRFSIQKKQRAINVCGRVGIRFLRYPILRLYLAGDERAAFRLHRHQGRGSNWQIAAIKLSL